MKVSAADFAQVQRQFSAYQDARAQLEALAQGIVDELREEFELHSENWQESEAGSEIDAWIMEWEDFLADVSNELELPSPSL